MSKRNASTVLAGIVFMSMAVGSAVKAEEAKDVSSKKTTVSVAEGKKTFVTMCASCHGNTGKGDGVAAAALDPKPRDLSNPEYMASLKDDYIVKLLKGGGAAVGKSPLMPALGAAMTDVQLTDLLAFVRTLAAKDQTDAKTETAAKAE